MIDKFNFSVEKLELFTKLILYCEIKILIFTKLLYRFDIATISSQMWNLESAYEIEFQNINKNRLESFTIIVYIDNLCCCACFILKVSADLKSNTLAVYWVSSSLKLYGTDFYTIVLALAENLSSFFFTVDRDLLFKRYKDLFYFSYNLPCRIISLRFTF